MNKFKTWRFKLVNKDGEYAQHDGFLVMMERPPKYQNQNEIDAEIEIAKQMVISKFNPDIEEDGEFAGYELQPEIIEWNGNVAELY